MATTTTTTSYYPPIDIGNRPHSSEHRPISSSRTLGRSLVAYYPTPYSRIQPIKFVQSPPPGSQISGAPSSNSLSSITSPYPTKIILFDSWENDTLPAKSLYSDVYAMGHVIIELLSGNKPFFEIPQENMIFLAVSKGHRAKRPESPIAQMWLTDPIWSLVLMLATPLNCCRLDNPRRRMSSVLAKRNLSESRNLCYEIVRSHATLAAPCFDLVALFKELKAHEPEASALAAALQHLRNVINAYPSISTSSARNLAISLELSLHKISTELQTFYRVDWTMSDRLFSALHILKLDDRRDALHRALAGMEEAIETYETRLEAYLERKAVTQARAFEEPLLAVLDGRLPPSTLAGLVY